MSNEDKLFFEQRFKGVGISESEFLLYLDCLRHSREVGSDSDIMLCRFDKKIEVNFSLGLYENDDSKTIGGFVSHDGNSILFDCEKNDYEANKITRYTEEFIFENGSIKRITTYDNKTYTDILPEFDNNDLYRFIEEKVSEIKGNNIKR